MYAVWSPGNDRFQRYFGQVITAATASTVRHPTRGSLGSIIQMSYVVRQCTFQGGARAGKDAGAVFRKHDAPDAVDEVKRGVSRKKPNKGILGIESRDLNAIGVDECCRFLL